MILSSEQFFREYPETFRNAAWCDSVFGEIKTPSGEVPYVLYGFGLVAPPKMVLRWKSEWVDITRDVVQMRDNLNLEDYVIRLEDERWANTRIPMSRLVHEYKDATPGGLWFYGLYGF
jgi:hypothetical protein